MTATEGVSFPSESTSSAARTIVADALRKADPVGARAVEGDTNWRRNYLTHFGRALEAGIGEAPAAHSIAAEGLRSAHALMRYDDVPLDEAITGTPLTQVFHTQTLPGGDRAAETELSLPYRGERLSGKALLDQLDQWVDAGIITCRAPKQSRPCRTTPTGYASKATQWWYWVPAPRWAPTRR